MVKILKILIPLIAPVLLDLLLDYVKSLKEATPETT